jgi:UDP-N-acetylglucosamine 2-epimerase (non-hydrolysing)
MKVMIVIGTRPQIIKSAPIITRAREYSKIELSVIHTGQHYDYEMSKVFFNELSLPDPIVNLNIGSGSHTWQIANMMLGLERIYNELSPDIVLVPGDTNSTLAGALTAVKMGISTFHIESGARSGDTGMPEEINRKIVDHISTRLYAVSENCVNNLLK